MCMTVRIERYQTFSMKCDHRTRVSPNIISFASSEETRTGPIPHVEATDLDSDCLQTFFWLFYQFYKIGTSLNVIRHMTQHLVWVCNVRQVRQTANIEKDTSCNRCVTDELGIELRIPGYKASGLYIHYNTMAIYGYGHKWFDIYI